MCKHTCHWLTVGKPVRDCVHIATLSLGLLSTSHPGQHHRGTDRVAGSVLGLLQYWTLLLVLFKLVQVSFHVCLDIKFCEIIIKPLFNRKRPFKGHCTWWSTHHHHTPNQCIPASVSVQIYKYTVVLWRVKRFWLTASRWEQGWPGGAAHRPGRGVGVVDAVNRLHFDKWKKGSKHVESSVTQWRLLKIKSEEGGKEDRLADRKY